MENCADLRSFLKKFKWIDAYKTIVSDVSYIANNYALSFRDDEEAAASQERMQYYSVGAAILFPDVNGNSKFDNSCFLASFVDLHLANHDATPKTDFVFRIPNSSKSSSSSILFSNSDDTEFQQYTLADFVSTFKYIYVDLLINQDAFCGESIYD